MQTITTNKSTVILDDLGRWVVAYGKGAPEVGGMHIGAKYFDTDDQKEYYWTGAAWSEVLSNPNFNESYYEDLRFPATGFNPAGSLSPPTLDTTTGLLKFDGAQDDVIGGVAQMPHDWERGTPIYPHLHLIAPTGNAGKNSRWRFEYNRANNTEAYENAYGSYTTLSTITVENPNSASTLLMPDSFGELDMTGYKESCCILWRVARLANSDAADDDNTDWILAEFDIHYKRGKTGTITVIPT